MSVRPSELKSMFTLASTSVNGTATLNNLIVESMPSLLKTHVGMALDPEAWSQRVSKSLSPLVAGAGTTSTPSRLARTYELGSVPRNAKSRMKRSSGAESLGLR